MRKVVIIVALSYLVSGCATLNLQGTSLMHQLNQRSKLSSAKEMLRKGDEDAAIKLLTQISADKGAPGITDEALFRLALIHLGNGMENDELAKAQKALERLRREYPASLWAIQSSGIPEFIARARPALENSRELRRQIKDLQNLNLYLTEENKKLQLNIEQLKTLDLELEQRQRH